MQAMMRHLHTWPQWRKSNGSRFVTTFFWPQTPPETVQLLRPCNMSTTTLVATHSQFCEKNPAKHLRQGLILPFQADRKRLITEVDHARGKRAGPGNLQCIKAELDGRRAGIEGQDQIARHAFTSALRIATSFASAAEAMRADKGSARLVSTIGTRAPSTSPAAVAPAK